MLLQDAMTDFLNYVLHERGLTKNTHKGYQAQLRHFHKWLVNEQEIKAPQTSHLTIETLRRFQYSLSERGLRPRSILSYFDPLDGLCGFLEANRALENNPVKRLTLPKKDDPIQNLVTNEEVQAILDAVELDNKPSRVAHNRAVLNVLIFQGLRRAELCDLKLRHVNLDGNLMLVEMGKGRKNREIPMDDRVTDALRQWLKVRAKSTRHDYVFTTDRSRRLWYNGLYGILDDVKARAGMSDHENILPHAFRHWRTNDLLYSGWSLVEVSTFLGHASVKYTEDYIHYNSAMLMKIRNRTMLGQGKEAQRKEPKVVKPRFRQALK